MSIVFDGPVGPTAATVFVRTVPTPSEHQLASFLPDKSVTSTTIKLAEGTRVNRSAQFRAFDGNIPQLERDSFSTREVDLLPMSIQGGKGELERLQLEKVRQGGGSTAAITEAIYDDLTLAVNAIRNRVETARGELLSTGKIVLQDENGLFLKADFEVPADNFKDVVTPWSSVNDAEVVQDLTAWVEYYTSLNGFAPGGMIINRRILGFLQRNAEFRSLLASLQGAPSIVGRSSVDQVLSDYGLPPIAGIYDTVLPDPENIQKRVIPENKVIFVPPNAGTLGNVSWGVTATAMELLSAAQTDLSFADAPGLVGVVIKSGPPYKESTLVDSLLLPNLENPKQLMVAEVF
nr:major capsid protein [Rhodococcus sp. (in: high G+C Gram-positive bacteria)]